jgi:FKBP-type peptidyl-prolyl cis-trans isomerase
LFMDKTNDAKDQDSLESVGGISPTPTASATPNMQNQPIELAGGLKIQDTIIGPGAEARLGNVVAVHYVGKLTNEKGQMFDSSRERGQPFSFILGSGQVIKGWDQGVQGMKVGGKRILIIPPSLGYGSQTVGGGLIPADSTLYFEVELLDVQEIKSR